MIPFRRIVLAAALIGMATPAWAEAPAPIPAVTERLVDAAKVFPFLDKFLTLPTVERSRLSLGYIVRQDGKAPHDLKLALVDGARRTPVPVAADGRVVRLPTLAELQAKTQVAVQAPKGSKMGITMALEAAIAPSEEIAAADCKLAIDQANGAIKKVAGVFALAAPHIAKTTFHGASAGTAVWPDGHSQPLPVAKGTPSFDPTAMKGAKAVRLDHAPTRIELE